MDERNERLVFDRIVRSCCTSRRTVGEVTRRPPQYFLVSPKLLMGLNAINNDDVTVLMVWNGPGVPNWQISDAISALKRKRNVGDNAVDYDINRDDPSSPFTDGSIVQKKRK